MVDHITSLEQLALSQKCVIQDVLGSGGSFMDSVEAYAYRDLGFLQIGTDLF